jgi:hypothetical protein
MDRVAMGYQQHTFEDWSLQMGLMDNIKNAQEMAKQAQEMAAQNPAGAGGMPGMDAEDMAQAQMMQRIATGGVPCIATIEAISETGKTDVTGTKQYAIQCEIAKDGEAPYKATIKQYLQDAAIASYQPGGRFDAKADPQDPSQAVLYGFAS